MILLLEKVGGSSPPVNSNFKYLKMDNYFKRIENYLQEREKAENPLRDFSNEYQFSLITKKGEEFLEFGATSELKPTQVLSVALEKFEKRLKAKIKNDLRGVHYGKRKNDTFMGTVWTGAIKFHHESKYEYFSILVRLTPGEL